MSGEYVHVLSGHFFLLSFCRMYSCSIICCILALPNRNMLYYNLKLLARNMCAERKKFSQKFVPTWTRIQYLRILSHACALLSVMQCRCGRWSTCTWRSTRAWIHLVFFQGSGATVPLLGVQPTETQATTKQSKVRRLLLERERATSRRSPLVRWVGF